MSSFAELHLVRHSTGLHFPKATGVGTLSS